MAKIVRVEFFMVNLQPKVRRADAIQSFVSQAPPFVRATDSDGAEGMGYSYTIGTGGASVVALIEQSSAPLLLGCEADELERIWRDMLFHSHATTVGPITAVAMAAIGIALWDLRCRRTDLPLHPHGWRRAGKPSALHYQGWLAASGK